MTTKRIIGSDSNELNTLWQMVGIDTLKKKELEMILKFNPDTCFKLVEKNKIIGSILGVFDGHRASIYRFAIHPECQKKGYGTMLLKKVEQKFRKKGVTKILLRVAKSNLKVKAFYYSNGYKDMDYAVFLYKNL